MERKINLKKRRRRSPRSPKVRRRRKNATYIGQYGLVMAIVMVAHTIRLNVNTTKVIVIHLIVDILTAKWRMFTL